MPNKLPLDCWGFTDVLLIDKSITRSTGEDVTIPGDGAYPGCVSMQDCDLLPGCRIPDLD